MSKPRQLSDFILTLPERLPHSTEQTLELCINGDFLDFLAIPPWSSWTADPAEAVAKFRQTVTDPTFRMVFHALEKHVERGHTLSVLLGNHDIELAFPSVQREFFSVIKADPNQVRFIDDGSAYQVGGVLIEHGNRYDGANVNDWNNLRIHKAAASRYESVPNNAKVRVSAGSELVATLIAPLKQDYPFLDLLKPEGQLLALLLLALEPKRIKLSHAARVWSAMKRQEDTLQGYQPSDSHNISASLRDDLPQEILDVFLDEIRLLQSVTGNIAASTSEQAYILSQSAMTGLGPLIRVWHNHSDLERPALKLPHDRLYKIHTILRHILKDTYTFARTGDIGPYGIAAANIHSQSLGKVDTVVMGHTHLARHVGPPDKATYINTGTWADLIVVPPELLAPWNKEELITDTRMQDFLVNLVVKHETLRQHHLTYADVVLDSSGQVRHAKLSVYESSLKELVEAHTAATQLPLASSTKSSV